MFRFFDFTVEEGKRYRYRVQLVLANPNHNVRPQYLKDAKLGKEQYKLSPKSEPSPIASVPTYNFLLAGKVKAADKPIDEPKANLIAIQLDPKMGTRAVYELRPPTPGKKEDRGREMPGVERGQAIKFSTKLDVVHPITRVPKEETVAFNAKMVLLDMRGGEQFTPGSLKDRDTIPGEVLLMDANGMLFTQTEVNDEPDYLAEVQSLEAIRLAKETNSTVPADGFTGEDGGEGGFPNALRRARNDGS
jgi:hypothetical protein